MKSLNISLLLFILLSCSAENNKSTHVVVENEVINTTYLKNIDTSEKMLLSWYLYAYGNECGDLPTVKCEILKELGIDNECESKHLNNLLQWFSNDMMAGYKLNKCPNLPLKSPIQNTIEKITIFRNRDTVSLEIKVKGLNNSQEKSWNITQKDKYLITNNNFFKISK